MHCHKSKHILLFASTNFVENKKTYYFIISNVQQSRNNKVCFITGLRIRIANLVIKLLTCVLYIIRVITDLEPTYATW